MTNKELIEKANKLCVCTDPYTREMFITGYMSGYSDAECEIQKVGLALQSDMDKTIEQNVALKASVEKQKEINKDYVDELEEARSVIRDLLKGAEGASIRASEYLYDL